MTDQFDPVQPNAGNESPDSPAEFGGVPVDEDIGSLPPEDGDAYTYYGAPDDAEPRKAKHPPRKPRSERGSRLPCFLIVGCLLVPCLCCLLCCGVVALFGGAAAWVYSNEVTESGSETVIIETDEVITVAVENTAGKISIRRGSSSEVAVAYTKYAYGFTTGQAKNNLDKMTVKVDTPSADRVVVTVDKDGDFMDFGEVRLTIDVPRDVHLVIDSNAAEIDVRELTMHSLDVNTDAGSIYFDGEIAPEANSDSRFNITTNAGEIQVRLPRNVHVNINANANVGEVTVSDRFSAVDGDERREVTSESWNGTLGEGEAHPPTLRLNTNTGEIVVQPR